MRNRLLMASLIAFPILAVAAFSGGILLPLVTGGACQEAIEDRVSILDSSWGAKVVDRHCNALSSSMEIQLENISNGSSQTLIAFDNPEPVSIYSDASGELTVAVPQSAKFTVSKVSFGVLSILRLREDQDGFDGWKNKPSSDQSRSWARDHGVRW